MPKPAAEHRGNVTLTMTAEYLAKLERVVEATASSKNAVLVAVIASLTEEELAAQYRRAVERGLVSPRGKTTPEQRALLEKINSLSPERMKALLAQLEAPTGS